MRVVIFGQLFLKVVRGILKISKLFEKQRVAVLKRYAPLSHLLNSIKIMEQ